ncbi:transposase [Thermus hydrothermalis]|uniref:transposase n=1 Tax=Thermus hydrothermalis TaxID=2908148 RepID=UPI003C12C1A9
MGKVCECPPPLDHHLGPHGLPAPQKTRAHQPGPLPLRSPPRPRKPIPPFLARTELGVQALGYVPLFLLDRGFDRVSLMRRLQEWGMGFLIRPLRHREVETGEGERYPEVPRAEGKRIRPFGHDGRGVEVGLFLAQGKREPGYPAFWAPEGWEPGGYRLRMGIEEAFRDLKGRGFGLDRHGLRTEGSLRGWLWLLFLGMVVLVLLGAALRGRGWWRILRGRAFFAWLASFWRRLLLPCGAWRCGCLGVFTRQWVQGWGK